jgi:hypothetical protein
MTKKKRANHQLHQNRNLKIKRKKANIKKEVIEVVTIIVILVNIVLEVEKGIKNTKAHQIKEKDLHRVIDIKNHHHHLRNLKNIEEEVHRN